MTDTYADILLSEVVRLRRIEKTARGFMDTFDRIPEPPTNDVHLAVNELRNALKEES